MRSLPRDPPQTVCETEAEGPQTVVGEAGDRTEGGAARPVEAREGGATKQRTWTSSKNQEQGRDTA